jgi:peptidoglycan/LPS O-acetylase OafA/YrhL
LVLLGALAIIAGVALMLSHRRKVVEASRREQDERIMLYEKRKFRRRSLASAMVAAIGIFLVALAFTHQPDPFVKLLSVVLILLPAVLVMAMLDMFSVGLHSVVSDNSARQEMIDEYPRQRKKLTQTVDDADSNGVAKK